MRGFRPFVAMLLAGALLAAGCGGSAKPAATETKPAAGAQETKKTWAPDKQVTMIVPYSAGGATDITARTVEKVWSKYVSQPLVIVNKPGAGAIEGRQAVVSSKPDGLTILMGYGSGEDLVTPQLRKLSYDVFTDLLPVARLSVHSIVVVVPANSPFKTIKDMIDWAKKENKPLTAASSGTANSVDLVVRGIGNTAGVQVTTVPFAGGAQSMTALVGGQTQFGGGHPSEVLPHIKAGRLRAIGVALNERDATMPDVPTLKEQGINFFTWGSVKGIAVPKGTAPEIIAYYEDVFKKITSDPDFVKAMGEVVQPIMYQDSKAFGEFFKQAYTDYSKVIKDLNITLQ